MPYPPLTKKIYAIGTGILLVLFILSIILIKNPTITATIADNFLRPVIGNKNTITVESWYFNSGDLVQKLQYRFKKPDANIFSSSLIAEPFAVNKAQNAVMDLENILPTPSFERLPQEGIWEVIPTKQFANHPVIAKTFIRPDPDRPYTIVSLVKMNMKALAIGLQGGTYYPTGAGGVHGPGVIPEPVQQSNALIAAFNGGFMEKDGHYGMTIGNTTYVPLQKGVATFAIYKDGTAGFFEYQGQPLSKQIIATRQNGTFLIRHGVITSFTENGKDTWGRTTTNSTYTWRSGIGITKNGDLVYAVGNSLVPQTLAKALHDAGAVDAMQLDINSFWVHYILYNSIGDGKYTYTPLLKEMQNTGASYLHSYNKDFFYLYKRPLS